MRKFNFLTIQVILFLGGIISGCHQRTLNKENIGKKGYVLKPGEGEIIFEDELLIVKASPESGTQGSSLFYDEMPGNGTSGIHYHIETDELFYVLEGAGKILIGEEETDIREGYFIFVPAGEDHRITSSSEEPLKVVYFVDKPGLAGQFREEARLKLDRTKMTIAEFNEIAKKYGSVYKSFD